jgi:hypothetical protein
MAFDTKATAPKVLFNPAGKVSDSDLQIIAQQSKSAAAEAAIKMNVYQADTVDEVPSHRSDLVEPESTDEDATPEPVKRESTKPAVAEKDISDVVKKWSKK